MPTDGPVPQSTSESAPTSAPTLGWRVYATPAMLVLAALGFSSGVPNLFATSIARTWTASVGWDVVAIGWLSFLQLPYALKFLWAPAVDRVRLPLLARLGQRRSWRAWRRSRSRVRSVRGRAPTTPRAPRGSWCCSRRW
jgi:hypothetical protein